MILLSGFHASFRRASSNDFLMPVVNVISGLPVDPMFGDDEFMLVLVQPSRKIWPSWMKYFKATGSPIAILAHQKYNLLEPLTSICLLLMLVVFNHEQREWGTQFGWLLSYSWLALGVQHWHPKAMTNPWLQIAFTTMTHANFSWSNHRLRVDGPIFN